MVVAAVMLNTPMDYSSSLSLLILVFSHHLLCSAFHRHTQWRCFGYSEEEKAVVVQGMIAAAEDAEHLPGAAPSSYLSSSLSVFNVVEGMRRRSRADDYKSKISNFSNFSNIAIDSFVAHSSPKLKTDPIAQIQEIGISAVSNIVFFAVFCKFGDRQFRENRFLRFHKTEIFAQQQKFTCILREEIEPSCFTPPRSTELVFYQ